MKLLGEGALCHPVADVGSGDWDRGLWENAGWAGRFARWASSPGFSVAAPATCLVALRARIRRCRLPTGSPQVTEGEEDLVRRDTARRPSFPGRRSDNSPVVPPR